MASYSNSFKPFPVLRTARLHLRELQPEDAPEVFAIRSNEAVASFLSRAYDQDEQQSLRFIRSIRKGVKDGDWLYWAIALKERKKLIGTICLWNFDPKRNRADIGYELHPDQQGKGFMQEALEAVVDFGFRSLQLQAIEACTQSGNKRSINLLRRNNFQFSRLMSPEEKYREEADVEMLIYTRQPS